MALLRWKALCIDAVDPVASGAFWGDVLGLDVATVPGAEPNRVLRGDTPERTVWINAVAEPKTVKNRVHLDLRTPSLAALGDLRRLTAPGDLPWTVLMAPTGDELCAFVDTSVERPTLKDLEIDSVDPAVIAAWWADVLGAEVHAADDASGAYSFVRGIEGAPFEDVDFSPVPEPKTVKNRVHWDVTLADGARVEDVLERGARMLRSPDDEVRWHVLADPEGNEFCVFQGV